MFMSNSIHRISNFINSQYKIVPYLVSLFQIAILFLSKDWENVSAIVSTPK